MVQQIDRVFTKFKDVFAGREEEIKNFILRHFEKDFKERIVEKIERIDATERIKTTGFRNNISSWRDSDKNIIISTCLLVNGKQKRYDYKIFFLKERFHSDDIERMKMTLNEVDNLRDKLKLKLAVVKLDSATKLAKEMNIPIYMEELSQVKEEITALDKDYNKKLDQLVESLRIHRENNNINEALKDCDEIFEISNSINRTDLMDKYNKITNRIMNEMITDKEKRETDHDRILNLENQMNKNRERKHLNEAISNCKEIIHIAKSNELFDYIEKYNPIIEQLKNEKIILDEKKNTLMNELKQLDEEIEFTLANDKLEEALDYSRKCIQISMTLENDDLIKKYQFISERIQKRITDVKDKFEDLKITIKRLNKEGLDALYGNKLVESLKKYKEIKDHLIRYIE